MKTGSNSPTCEIVTIGTELLLGQITDTNTTFLARELGKIGVSVKFRTAVGDQLEEIERVVRNAAARCDMVITTGGLGPTIDDLTREAVSAAAEKELVFREDLMKQIEEFFRSAGYHMTENNRRQAFVPVGSQVIPNPVGTAPAFILRAQGKPVICLPGVPRELEFLMNREVLPWLINEFRLKDQIIFYKVLKTAGIGESAVDRLIGDLMSVGGNPEVGLLASAGEIKIRITAKADDKEKAMNLISPIEADIRLRLKEKIFGEDEDSLEGVINGLLTERSATLAMLETFTGGLIAQRFCQLPFSKMTSSLVIPRESDVCQWLGNGDVTFDQDLVQGIAHKIQKTANADVGFAVVGFPEEREDRYVITVHSHVSIDGVEKHYSWQTGGDFSMLQQRGAVVGLNTLRLALINT